MKSSDWKKINKMNEKNANPPASRYESPSTSKSAAVAAASACNLPHPPHLPQQQPTTSSNARNAAISTDPHSVSLATAQLHTIGAKPMERVANSGGQPPPRTIIRKIINIDKTKLAQFGLDRKMAEALSKQKLATKSSAVASAAEKAQPHANEIVQCRLLTPAERLIEAKRLLNIKLHKKGSSVPSASTVPVAIISRPATTISVQTTKLPTKAAVRKIQTPQEIARVLDFDIDYSSSSSNVQPNSSTAKSSHETNPQKPPPARATNNNPAEKVPPKTPHKLPVKVTPLKHSDSYAGSFKSFVDNKQEDNDDIPKASIRKSFDNRCIPPTTTPKAAAVQNDLKSLKNVECTMLSPLKIPFPTTTLPQEAPLPTISTFKKPFLPQKVNITNVSYAAAPDAKEQHITKSLIVLEDKVLSHDEKIDLTTVFGLSEPNDAKLPKPIIIKEEKHDDMHQSFHLPAIGATVSTDPKQGLVVVNSTQPKKFIIAPDKLKLSKDKIAALAKQIKTQVPQKTKKLNLTELKESAQKKKQNIQIKKLYPSAMDTVVHKNEKSLENICTQQETPKFSQNAVNLGNSFDVAAPIPIMYGDTVINFESTLRTKPEKTEMFNTNDPHLEERSKMEKYPFSDHLISTSNSIETIEQFGEKSYATHTVIFEAEKPTTSKSTIVNNKPIIIASQNAKPTIILKQSPGFKVILQNPNPNNNEKSYIANAALNQNAALNKNVVDTLIKKPFTKVILLKKIPNVSTTLENTSAPSTTVQSVVSNFEIQTSKDDVNLNVNQADRIDLYEKPTVQSVVSNFEMQTPRDDVNPNVNQADRIDLYEKPTVQSVVSNFEMQTAKDDVNPYVNQADRIDLYKEPTTPSKIQVQATTSRKAAAVCILNNTESDPGLSAVDFIASLGASSFLENYTQGLSAEERELNASLNISLSEKMLLKNVTSSENVTQPTSKNNVNAILITQMFNENNSKDTTTVNEECAQFSKDITETKSENVVFDELIKMQANKITTDNLLMFDEIEDQQKKDEEISDTVVASNADNIMEHALNKPYSSTTAAYNNIDNLSQSDQVIESTESTHENNQIVEQDMTETNVTYQRQLTQDYSDNTSKVVEPKPMGMLNEDICELIEDKKNLNENIKYHEYDDSTKPKTISNEQPSSSSSNRQPLRMKKGRINLVQRKKTPVLIEANDKEQIEKQNVVDQEKVMQTIQNDFNTEILNAAPIQITDKTKVLKPERLQKQRATKDLTSVAAEELMKHKEYLDAKKLSEETTQTLQNFDVVNENTQNELQETIEPQSRSMKSKKKRTRPSVKKAQTIKQDLQAQKDKESEVAKVLMSLIQPPPDENEENILKPAKIPFKQQSLDAKNKETIVGITCLINQIEANKLQKETTDDVSTKEQQKIISSTEDKSLQQNKELTEVNVTDIEPESSKSGMGHIAIEVNSSVDLQAVAKTILQENSEAGNIAVEVNSSVETQAVAKTIIQENSEPNTVDKNMIEVPQITAVKNLNSARSKHKMLNSDNDLEEKLKKDAESKKETVSKTNKRTNRSSKSEVIHLDEENIQISIKESKSATSNIDEENIKRSETAVKSITALVTSTSMPTANLFKGPAIHIDHELADKANTGSIHSSLNKNAKTKLTVPKTVDRTMVEIQKISEVTQTTDVHSKKNSDDAVTTKLTDEYQKTKPVIVDENESRTNSAAVQSSYTTEDKADAVDKLLNTSISQNKETPTLNLDAVAETSSIESSARSGSAGKDECQISKNKLEKEEKTTQSHHKSKKTLPANTINKLQDKIKLSTANKKRRLDSKLSTTDTQSDIDITDLDCSTRESNDDTAKEESSQKQAVTKTIRKRLRKTVDVNKAGHKENTETDTDDEHNISNPDSNEFFGFDETSHNHSKVAEKLKILIAATSAEEESADDQLKPKEKKSKKTNNKTTTVLKVTAKTMPLKKRWEFAHHKPPTEETDITDDTSPEHDDDDNDNFAGSIKHEPVISKIAQKRKHDESKSSNESQIIKKPKKPLIEKPHVFVEPQRIIKLSPTNSPQKEFISNTEIVKSFAGDLNLIEKQMVKEKRSGRPSRKLPAATSSSSTLMPTKILDNIEMPTTNENPRVDTSVLTPTTSATTFSRKRGRKSDSTVIASKLVIMSKSPVAGKPFECSTPKTRGGRKNEEKIVELSSMENSSIKLEPKSIIQIFTTSEKVNELTKLENIEENHSISNASKINSADKKQRTNRPKSKTSSSKANDLILSNPIENTASKTVLAASTLSVAIVEKTKGGHKATVLDTSVAEESCAESNTSIQIPEANIEFESIATAGVKRKRGRKSKSSILECNYKSRSVSIESDGEHFADSNTPIEAIEALVEPELKATTVADVTIEKKKRGRKPKLPTIETDDTCQSVEMDISTNSATADISNESDCREPLQNTTSAAANVTVEKKRRGRKPKLPAVEADGISTMAEMDVSKTSASSHIGNESEKKKPGRKRIYFVAGEGDTNLMDNPEFINERLLLITARSQLDTNEKLTKNDGKPAAGYFKCGLCFGNSKKDKWLLHLSEHYGVGWIDGETPLDITSRSTVLNTMTNYYKQTQVKGLNCRICKHLYRSALGLLTHLESCGLSAAELQKSRINCEYCSKSYTKLSFISHVRTCSARIAAEKTKDEVRVEEVPLVEVFNNVGRVKRVSLLKAENIIKKIGQELSTTASFDPNQIIKFVPPFTRPDWQSKCQSELIEFGKIFCLQTVCKFFCTDLAEMEQHLRVCKFIPKTGYHCTKCNKKSSVFETNELALKHVNKAHKPREGQDFDGDSTGSDIGNESSSEDESISSGVDSNEENVAEENENDDDLADNDETYGRSTKVKHKKNNQPQRKRKKRLYVPRPPQCESKFQSVFPLRSPDVDKLVVKSWKEFITQNYSLNGTALFDSLTPQIHKLDSKKEMPLEKSLPSQNASLKFAFASFKNVRKSLGAPVSESIEWLELKRFETHARKADLFTFIGAPIKAFAWAPLPTNCDTENQFLAICYRKDINKYIRFQQPKLHPTHILIYKVNMKADNNADKIKQHYSIHIPEGPVHCFEFIPSGGYAPALNRLGLLAVGTASNDIHVYSLPLEIAENTNKQDENELFKLNVINLQSAFVLSLNLNTTTSPGERLTEAQCLKLKWSEFRGHKLIFAGFSNGFIGTWDISDDESENLNCFVVGAVRHFVPVNYFYCGEKIIQDMAVHYDTNGPRWLAITAYGRTLMVLDLIDLTNPLILRSEIAKNFISALDWPIMWENFAMAMGSALQNQGEMLCIKSTIGLQYGNHSRVQLVPGGATQAKFNPWYSLYVTASEYGDLIFQKMREMHFESGDLKSKSNMKVVAALDVKCLNGQAMPKAPGVKESKSKNPSDVDENWKMFEDDYKEKYGLVFTSLEKLQNGEFFADNRHPPENITRYMRINCSSWNLNSNGRNLLACGYENGFLRIHNFKATEFFD